MGNGGGGRGQKRAAKVHARQQRLAREEERREQHAQVVTERSGDPRFVQRVNHPDGTATVSWAAETPTGQSMREAMELQREAFRTKFGREPGPADPLMFDPDADEPTFLTEERMAAVFEEMVDSVAYAGGDTALAKSWRDLGYVVTTDTQHLFSAAEVAAWDETYGTYLETGVGGSEVDDDAEEPDVGDLLELLDSALRRAVHRTISEALSEPAREVASMIIAGDVEAMQADSQAPAVDGDPAPLGEGSLGLSLAFAVLAGWLTAMREDRPGVPMAVAAVEWVRTELGEAPAAAALRASGLLGAEHDADLTVQGLLDELQEEFVPALVWLTAGAVARFGGGDVTRLPSLDRDDTPGT